MLRPLAILLIALRALSAPAEPWHEPLPDPPEPKSSFALPGSRFAVRCDPEDSPVPEPALDGSAPLGTDDTIENREVPSGEDLFKALLTSARQRCKPANDKEAPVGKLVFSFALTRDPKTEDGTGALRVWTPIIGVSMRF